MNEENNNSEQITKEPAAALKIKDPKRVEAGKQLAEYNKKAKKQQKDIIQNKLKHEDNSANDELNDSRLFPDIYLTSIIAIIGLIFTGVDLFLRYKTTKEERIASNQSQSQSQSPRLVEKDEENNFPKCQFGME